MIRVPKGLWQKYDTLLKNEGVPSGERGQCRKCLRYYLDFCHKYGHAYELVVSLPPFLEKLTSKGQSNEQRAEASAAVSLYFRMLAERDEDSLASHLLQANYDIVTIQKLLGHSNVKATMIYTQTVPSVTLTDAKSPLDL